MNFEELKELIIETLDIEEEKITPEASLYDDLDIDSLDAMELSMAIEEKCGINIMDDDISEVKTIEDILKILEQ